MATPEQIQMSERVTVDAIINNNVEKVWEAYTTPECIKKWAFADDSWHAPKAENDLREGGSFYTRMEAKDGSAGFDFTGEYTKVIPNERIEYVMPDNRKVIVVFEAMGNSTHVKVEFDTETENTADKQREGWQHMLNNFKTVAETIG